MGKKKNVCRRRGSHNCPCCAGGKGCIVGVGSAGGSAFRRREETYRTDTYIHDKRKMRQKEEKMRHYGGHVI